MRAELVDFGEVRVPIKAAAATQDLGALAKGTRSLVARWSGQHGRSPLTALAVVATEGGGEVGAVMLPADLLDSAAVAKKLTATLAEPVLGHQVKEVMRSLLPLGIDCTGLVMDTGVAAYLLDASSGEYELSDLRGTDDGQLQLSMGDPDAGAVERGRVDGGRGARRGRAGRGLPEAPGRPRHDPPAR